MRKIERAKHCFLKLCFLMFVSAEQNKTCQQKTIGHHSPTAKEKARIIEKKRAA